GLMFPASASFPVIYLSILFSGKIPVLVNWTTGTRSILEMMDMLNVHMIVTSRAFTEKLTSLGTDLSAISDRFIFAEDFAVSVKLTEKISSALKLRFFPGLLHGKKYPDTAAILFTSGSESTPKAVPLTHENILSNIRDAINSFTLYNHDSLIGILPPFHSFGLTVTILLPALCGLKTCYHPNPTEGRMIAKLINSYKTTVMIATPTFLDTIAQNAESEDLAALRLVVAGAEKCPLRLYDFIENNWPKLRIIEGYGITECSPVVSVNREENPVRGSIGKLLPSFEYSIINPDTGEQVAEGESGILLLRGPSVFGGYLNYFGKSPFITFKNLQWYNSGDIVKEEDGSLFFTGRLKRFIKLGGEMISLPLIEEILSDSFTGNEGEVVIAVDSNGDDENPEIILFHTIDLTRNQANSLLREKGLSPIYFIRKTIKIDEIPKLGSGKTDYRKLRLLVS
ncbi:MAG TPA: AMP-binding protein, partial [Spirochaetota bacterium]|nr:AMP-binding protein [Spirochaetota bacterium]